MSTNSHLFGVLAEFLAQKHNCQILRNVASLLDYFRFLHRRLAAFWEADALVLHTYAVFSLDLILLSKVFKKKTIVFAWDEYPAKIRGASIIRRSLFGVVRDALEHLSMSLIDQKVVPTEDFKLSSHSKSVCMPLWPILRPTSGKPSTERNESEITKIAFTGNINVFRGLDKALKQLDLISVEAVEVHLFSSDHLSPQAIKCLRNVVVVERGFLSKSDLNAALAEMDFGLVSLDQNFESAAFPSKVFDYVAADLPVLYIGPMLVNFIRLIEKNGIGVSLMNKDRVDFQQLSGDLIASYELSKANFNNATQLNWDKLDKIF